MTQRRLCPGPCGKRRDEAKFTGPRSKCATCRRDATRRSARKTHLWKTYEITVEEYDRMLKNQGGVCAICKGGRSYNLAVDHDHSLVDKLGMRASVRGLLCKRCNKFLRDIRDNRVILYDGIDYLLNPPAIGSLQ